ncbi:unnamed protein product [Paramecium primaurelia]|uniref:Transmembrane protein n=1 Tax=Paramecium primaurelia TaxID=5886 RepID=A0A8S1PLZ2_PARPR|nr:unnamed protein product [Paramecium primaurelia]
MNSLYLSTQISHSKSTQQTSNILFQYFDKSNLIIQSLSQSNYNQFYINISVSILILQYIQSLFQYQQFLSYILTNTKIFIQQYLQIILYQKQINLASSTFDYQFQFIIKILIKSINKFSIKLILFFNLVIISISLIIYSIIRYFIYSQMI